MAAWSPEVAGAVCGAVTGSVVTGAFNVFAFLWLKKYQDRKEEERKAKEFSDKRNAESRAAKMAEDIRAQALSLAQQENCPPEGIEKKLRQRARVEKHLSVG